MEGRGGVFDVAADGEVIHSKRAAGTFPTVEDIVARLPRRPS